MKGETPDSTQNNSKITIERIYLILSIIFFLYLIYYYYTGAGGPLRLAVIMVPFSFILYTLDSMRSGLLYPRLSRQLNYIIIIIYASLALASASYITMEFNELIGVRLGSYNLYDVIFGAIMFFLVLEYSRKRHFALFIVNVFLFAYALYGFLPGPFRHTGLPLRRLLTAMSVEFETGVFERLPQLALTVIGAFIVFVSIAQGFGLVRSIIRTVVSKAASSARAIPQAAVVSSMSVASVSGSGAANAATTGSVTIPLMKRVGISPRIAAAIETASSIGGQLMPPIMGISAFVMADFMGTSYFEVVARGYMPALLYYVGVAIAVFFIARRFLPKRFTSDELTKMGIQKAVSEDYYKILTFLLGIILLIILMGYYYVAPTYAALTTSWITLIIVSIITIYSSFKVRGEGKSGLRLAIDRFTTSILDTIKRFAGFTSDLTLLLSTLGIMTGLLTITGIPIKIGFILMSIGQGNLLALAGIGFLFGYIVGLGLPPVVTYILTVIVIAPYFIEAGIDPWVVHFYAFFIGVFSELSPPTSVTAAVAAKIAEAPFTRTMIEAMKFAMPLFILIPGVILHPELVVEPGYQQIITGVLLLGSMLIIISSIWSTFSSNPVIDLLIRLALFSMGIITLFSQEARFTIFGLLSLIIGVMIVLYTRRL
ncbi:MAG: TRAP transporter fused permease subunit [Desulfurococcales archaeon]|nr:TRAP transporter fused permease subunit [Desulfurococcales archaeon]